MYEVKGRFPTPVSYPIDPPSRNWIQKAICNITTETNGSIVSLLDKGSKRFPEPNDILSSVADGKFDMGVTLPNNWSNYGDFRGWEFRELLISGIPFYFDDFEKSVKWWFCDCYDRKNGIELVNKIVNSKLNSGSVFLLPLYSTGQEIGGHFSLKLSNSLNKVNNFRFNTRIFGLSSKMWKKCFPKWKISPGTPGIPIYQQLAGNPCIYPNFSRHGINAFEFGDACIDMYDFFVNPDSEPPTPSLTDLWKSIGREDWMYIQPINQKFVYYTLIFNLDFWESLSNFQKKRIISTCHKNVNEGFKETSEEYCNCISVMKNTYGVNVVNEFPINIQKSLKKCMSKTLKIDFDDLSSKKIINSYLDF